MCCERYINRVVQESVMFLQLVDVVCIWIPRIGIGLDSTDALELFLGYQNVYREVMLVFVSDTISMSLKSKHLPRLL